MTSVTRPAVQCRGRSALDTARRSRTAAGADRRTGCEDRDPKRSNEFSCCPPLRAFGPLLGCSHETLFENDPHEIRERPSPPVGLFLDPGDESIREPYRLSCHRFRLHGLSVIQRNY